MKRLTRAARLARSPVVARRLGYLVELLAGEAMAQPLHDLFGAPHDTEGLDPGDDDAPIVPRWHLRTKLAPEELLEHRVVS